MVVEAEVFRLVKDGKTLLEIEAGHDEDSVGISGAHGAIAQLISTGRGVSVVVEREGGRLEIAVEDEVAKLRLECGDSSFLAQVGGAKEKKPISVVRASSGSASMTVDVRQDYAAFRVASELQWIDWVQHGLEAEISASLKELRAKVAIGALLNRLSWIGSCAKGWVVAIVGDGKEQNWSSR